MGAAAAATEADGDRGGKGANPEVGESAEGNGTEIRTQLQRTRRCLVLAASRKPRGHPWFWSSHSMRHSSDVVVLE